MSTVTDYLMHPVTWMEWQRITQAMMHVVTTVYASRFETSIANQKGCVDWSGIVGGRLDDECPAVVFVEAMKFLRSERMAWVYPAVVSGSFIFLQAQLTGGIRTTPARSYLDRLDKGCLWCPTRAKGVKQNKSAKGSHQPPGWYMWWIVYSSRFGQRARENGYTSRLHF